MNFVFDFFWILSLEFVLKWLVTRHVSSTANFWLIFDFFWILRLEFVLKSLARNKDLVHFLEYCTKLMKVVLPSVVEQCLRACLVDSEFLINVWFLLNFETRIRTKITGKKQRSRSFLRILYEVDESRSTFCCWAVFECMSRRQRIFWLIFDFFWILRLEFVLKSLARNKDLVHFLEYCTKLMKVVLPSVVEQCLSACLVESDFLISFEFLRLEFVLKRLVTRLVRIWDMKTLRNWRKSFYLLFVCMSCDTALTVSYSNSTEVCTAAIIASALRNTKQWKSTCSETLQSFSATATVDKCALFVQL